MEATRRHDVDEAGPKLSEILELVAAGHEVIITESGEPVAEVVPFSGEAQGAERG
ncbi:type II toxin-antitoxin system Phd/YefM family antitoxin [Streptomyces sp. NPDC088762]|uniref:type II toxin-antitoxin system Phd/YefM family antitoxin n=1 Tax=Streptomyces sp. NPDC088762 TaxID=3365891 RepID=UPI00381E6041